MRYDFIVVGAGIVGLSTAYHLARKCSGCRILVVDRHSGPGHGDTGRSAGAFRAFFYSKTNMALAATSIRFYRHVQEREGFDLGLKHVGYLFLLDEELYEAVKPVLGELEKRGLGYRVYEPSVLEELLGVRVRVAGSEEAELMGLKDIVAGILAEEAGIMRPEKLVEYYYAKSVEAGVEFMFNTIVESLIIEAEKPLGLPYEPLPWQKPLVKGVRLSKGGEVRADAVVAAMGAEAQRVLDKAGVDAGAKPKKRQVFVLRASTSQLKRLLQAEGFNEYSTAPFILLPKGVYLRPVPEENSFWTGVSDHLGRPFHWEPDPRPESHFYTYGIYPVLREYFPQFENKAPESSWAGYYDLSIDGQPVVYGESGLVVAGGTSGSGIMKADAIGRIASSIALGEKKAILYGGEVFDTDALSLKKRRVEEEKLVI